MHSEPSAATRTMIGPDEALELVLQTASRLPSRPVPLAEACGLQLAEPIHADRQYPPFPRATMDGYAVRTVDAGRTVAVIGEVAAGENVKTAVTERKCLEIMTGAPCPPGTEAVVQKEEVTRRGDRVILPEGIGSGQNIAPQGSECPAGRLALKQGETITPLAVAVLASFGWELVRVTPRPSLAVITTGGELVPSCQDPAPAQIRDSNGPMLLALARDMGIDRPLHLHAQDRLEAILGALDEAADRDMVLLTGGVSAGKYDLVPNALERYGAEGVFHKVTQKPGKPLLLARKGPQLVFGLPGNPLGCHLCFHRYVVAAIRQSEGKPPMPALLQGELAAAVEPKGRRTCFVPARADLAGEEQRGWQIHPLPGATSADIFASCRANCYAEVPPGEAAIPAGELLTFTWIGNAPWPN